MAQSRTTSLQIIGIAASDLQNVNWIHSFRAYARVSIQGDRQHPEQSIRTPTDRAGGRNPTWNSPMTFTLYDAPAQYNRLSLVFELRCEHPDGDRHVGQVAVPITQLLTGGDHGQFIRQAATYQVVRPSGNAKGKLTFSYTFDHSSAAVSGVSYGAPPPSYAGSAAPPTAPFHGYPPLHPAAYAHPPAWPPAASYGQQPPAGQQQPMINNLVAAVTTGLVGELGEHLIGDFSGLVGELGEHLIGDFSVFAG